MALNIVTHLLGYDFETAQRFAEGLATKMTGNKFIIKFDEVMLKCSQTKQGLKLEGELFGMRFMFLYTKTSAYVYTEQIPRPIALFYDVIHLISGYLKIEGIKIVELAMNNTEIENYIAALVKSTDSRFKSLVDIVFQFKWPEPIYRSIAGNLIIRWYSAKAENPTAVKIIARFKEEYMIQEAILLEVRKGYDQVLLLFCGNDVFYASDEIAIIDPMLVDVTRITHKFIIKVERDDKDKARSIDLKTIT